MQRLTADYLGLVLVSMGALFSLIALIRLGKSLSVEARDGISDEGGYQTAAPLWGFLVVGLIFLLAGTAMFYLR